MSRRLLRRGLFSVALFGAAALAPLASAKPPDLPAEVKNVATPSAVEPEIVIDPEPPAAERVDAEEAEPAFYRLHLADRKTMTSCLLFAVNPLLALTPPDKVLYWPLEAREALADAAKSEDQTGSLMFGVGVNSDEGLTSGYSLYAASLKHGRGKVRVNYEIEEQPVARVSHLQIPPAAPAETICPYLKNPNLTPVPVSDATPRTVLDNLKALEESDRLLESGREMLRTGRLCEALDFFEKIARLCPGSRYDEMADALVAEVFKHFPAAAEEAEDLAETKTFYEQFRVYDTPLTHILSDLLSGQGFNFYLQNPPVPQEEESEEEQELHRVEAQPKEIKNRQPGIEPAARIMADGLLKAARLALETGHQQKAIDLARQAFALDPARKHELDLLGAKPMATRTIRVNNVATVCPCSGSESGIVGEPSLRPNLPGVDPRVVAALEKVLAESEAKRPRLSLFIEEEQEPRSPSTSVEIAEPFALAPCKRVTPTREAWDCVRDYVSPDDCVDLLKEVADLHLSLIFTSLESGKTLEVSLGLLGWSLEEVASTEDE